MATRRLRTGDCVRNEPGLSSVLRGGRIRTRTYLRPWALRAVLSTGSILYERQYDWVRDQVYDLPLQSISGGTDIIGCFVLGNPNLPVYRGEAQCK